MTGTYRQFERRHITRTIALVGALALSTTGCAWLARSSVPTGPPPGWFERGDSDQPAISASGRYVAFVSSDTTLGTGAGIFNVFVRDNLTNTTELMSATTAGAAAGGNSPRISDDGRYVAFSSSSASIVPGDLDGMTDVFVRDRIAGTTTLASVNDDESAISTAANALGLSGDGGSVAFCIVSGSIGPLAFCGQTAVRNVASGTTRLLPYLHTATMAGEAVLSHDGSRVAYTELFFNGSASTISAAVADITSGTILADLRTSPFHFAGETDFALDLSPDGSTYAITESHTGVPGSVEIGRVEGTSPPTIRAYGWAAQARLRNDNTTIALLTRVSEITETRPVLVVDDGVNPLRIVGNNSRGDHPVYVTNFDFSHDGQWVAFATRDGALDPTHGTFWSAIYTRSVAQRLDPPN
ncbi:MAG: hypothetical protein ABIP21_00015 [Acidimicrobiia bacterium]